MSRIRNFDQVVEQLKTKLVDYLEEQEINTKQQFSCIHPEHNDEKPSCGVVAGSDYTRWNCLACHQTGDIFDACAYLEDKPASGPDFIKENVLYLADKYGISVQIQEPTEEEKYRMEAYNAYKKAAHYIANHANEKATTEMNRRGWNPAGCAERLIGSLDSYENYKNHMKNQGFSVSFLESMDLLRTHLFSENSLLFTVCDEFGRPCGFGARNLDYDPTNKDSRKYINSKNFGTDVKCQIYEKSKRLYNIHNTKKCQGTLYIMEGYGDVETCIQAGLPNVVCVGGTSFTDYHIVELSKMGKTDITICMDGDTRGTESLNRMLEKFNNYKEFSIYVVVLPENLDPDDYIREYGLERFKRLNRRTAFEWKLDSYDDRIDTSLIRKEVIPIIASELSPIVREKMAQVLSERIEVTQEAIKEEVKQVLDQTEARRAQEQNGVIQALVSDLKICPSEWRLSINKAVGGLESLSQTYNEDTFSLAAYLKDLEAIETAEREADVTQKAYEFAQWREMTAALRGDYIATLGVIGGGANVGKTGFMGAMALQLAQSDLEDIMVIFHTIDDTLRQFTTRQVCQFAQQQMNNITLNMIKNPNGYPNSRVINRARKYGYNKLRELIAKGRLLVRGGEGKGTATLSFADDMIKYYQQQHPDKQIIYFLDNFHRLRDFSHISEERIRFKSLSNSLKDICKHRTIGSWATMEYTKAAGQERPNNSSISESVAMEYDANVIAHMYNEHHVKREAAETYFVRTDSEGREVRAPRIELIFGKNKISEFKNTLFFDFYTEQSRFVPVPSSVVMEDRQKVKNAMEEERKARYANSYR